MLFCDPGVTVDGGFACFHVDAPTVDIFTHNFDGEDVEDEYENGISHTMELFHLLEDDNPPCSGISAGPISVQGRLREHTRSRGWSLHSLCLILSERDTVYHSLLSLRL